MFILTPVLRRLQPTGALSPALLQLVAAILVDIQIYSPRRCLTFVPLYSAPQLGGATAMLLCRLKPSASVFPCELLLDNLAFVLTMLC